MSKDKLNHLAQQKESGDAVPAHTTPALLEEEAGWEAHLSHPHSQGSEVVDYE